MEDGGCRIVVAIALFECKLETTFLWLNLSGKQKAFYIVGGR